MQIVVGLLSDIYGARKILLVAIISCTLGSYIFSIAHVLTIAACGRALIGFGSAFGFVCILKLADNWLPKRFFALFVGIATSVGMLSAIFQVTFFNNLITRIGWHNVINTGTWAGVVLIPIIWLIIRDAPTTKTAEKPSLRKTISGLLFLCKRRQLWISSCIASILYLSLSLFAELWAIPFLHHVHHLSQHNASNSCSLIYLGWLVGGPLIGYISDLVHSRKRPLIIGCVVSTVAVSLLVFVHPLPVIWLDILLFLFGFSASTEVLCFAINTANSPAYLVATATAFTNCVTMLGGFIMQPFFGKLLDLLWDNTLIHGVRIYSESSYLKAFTLIPLLFVASIVLVCYLKDTDQIKSS